MHETDPQRRFSNRVDNYVKYRPSYPPRVLECLREMIALSSGDVIADVGSGTGILTRLLLSAGHRVYAVEPNDEMREAAEVFLADCDGHENFVSVAGSAETTTLDGASVDVVTAAQAFHWFDPVTTRREFARILRPGGRVALMWNERRSDATPFMVEYEKLLHERGVDYAQVDHRNVDDRAISAFLDHFESRRIRFIELLDLASSLGRMLSASYVPAPGHPKHVPIVAGLREAFARHAVDDRVEWVYDTIVYAGRI